MKRILMATFVVAGRARARKGRHSRTLRSPPCTAGDVFVIAQVTTPTGAMHDYFAPGDKVVFRAYAVDGKSHQILVAKDVKYFYVTIPNQANVKLAYDAKAPAASGEYAWTGTWTIPSTYPTGTVAFKVLVQSKTKRRGSFVQMPVASSMLTISTTPPGAAAAGPGGVAPPTGAGDHGRLRRQRERDASRSRRGAADRMHADERVQARRAVRAPHVGLRPRHRRGPLARQRQRGALHRPGRAERHPELGLARHGQGVLLDERLADPGRLRRSATRPCTSSSRSRAGRPRSSTTRSSSPPSASSPPDAKARAPMSTRTHIDAHLGAALAGALLLSAPAVATPGPLTAPAIPGVAALPGPIAAPATTSADLGCSRRRPTSGFPARPSRISGSGLPANKDVSIVWNTANVTWVVDARPDSVDYLGRKADKISVVFAQAKTDAKGAFSINAARRRRTSAASTTSTQSSTACRSPRAAS